MSLHLFEAFGVELEYMLVDAESLAVQPVADRVLAAAAGEITSDLDDGPLSWSNELVLHVIELKTNGPAPALEGLPEQFDAGVRRIGEILAELPGATGGGPGRLMPTAMHPFFDPETETRLWPHDNRPIYQAYDRIFGCRGHGWSNLQATHLNLPFSGDEEFGRLHAAIRLLLPILPALAASSPVSEGRVSGLADTRLEVYRTNSRRFASITGQVVPEPVYTRADYEREILRPIYRDLAPLDHDEVLQEEFANARGAIARFSRGSIEIRVLDVQECPRADLAVVAAIVGVLKLLVAERWASWEEQARWPTAPLAALLRGGIAAAEKATIDDPGYLELFGFPGEAPATAGELWRQLVASAIAEGTLDAAIWSEPLAVILHQGPLARRMLARLGADPGREEIAALYRELCDCLAAGTLFAP